MANVDCEDSIVAFSGSIFSGSVYNSNFKKMWPKCVQQVIILTTI